MDVIYYWLFHKRFEKTHNCLKTNLSTFRSAHLGAARWLMSILVLCGAGVHAAEPTFTNVTATVLPGLPALYETSITWGDYDNDRRLDFLLTGYFFDQEGSEISVSQLWRNTGSMFTNVTPMAAPGLPGMTAPEDDLAFYRAAEVVTH